MGFDPFTRMQEKKERTTDGFAVAASLAPAVGVASYLWKQQVKNGPINPVSSLGLKNDTSDFGRELGKALKPKEKKEAAIKAFLEGDAFAKVVSKAQDRRALIQSVLIGLDADELGVDKGALADLKDKLLKIGELDQDDLADDLIRPLREVIDTLNTSGNDSMRSKVAENFQELKAFKKKIVPAKPFGSRPSSTSFRVLDQSALTNFDTFRTQVRSAGANAGDEELSRIFNDQVGSIKRFIGTNLDNAQLVVVDAAAGVKSLNLRIMQGTKGNMRPVMNLPVAFNLGNTDASMPNITRMGRDFATGYFVPQGVIDTREILHQLKEGKITPGNVKGVQSNMKSFGSYALGLLEEHFEMTPSGRLKSRLGTTNKKAQSEMFAVLNANMENMPRSLSATLESNEAQAEYQSHVKKRAGAKHKTVLLTHGEALTDADFNYVHTSLIGGDSPFDPGVGASRLQNIIGGRKFGLLQLSSHSVHSRYRLPFKVSRKDAPLIARQEQVEGRIGQFIARGGKENNPTIRGGLTLGEETASPILEGMTGHKNVLVAVDVTMGKGKGAYSAAENEGQYFVPKNKGAGLGAYITESTIPLLDPEEHKLMSSELLEQLKADFEAGKPPRYFTLEEIGKLNGYLGHSTLGNRTVRIDPRMLGAYMGIAETTSASGKKQIHLTSRAVRKASAGKVFSTSTVKGTYRATRTASIRRDLSTYGRTNLVDGRLVREDVFDRILTDVSGVKSGAGLNIKGSFITGSGDVLKKSAANRANFLLTSAAVSLGQKHSNLLHEMTGKVSSSEEHSSYLFNKIATAFEAGQISESQAANSLSLPWWGGGRGTGKGAYAPEMKSIADEMLKRSQETTEQGKKWAALLELTEKGLQVGVDTVTQGTGHGDYGLGRASIEPRAIGFIRMSLQDMGFDSKQQVNFMREILSRKVGGTATRRTLEGLTTVMASQISAPIDGASKMPSFTVNQLLKEANTPTEFKELMRKNENGFFIDFNNEEDLNSSIFREAAREKYGNDRRVFIAGKRTIENMKGTEIKQSNQTVKVASAYEEMSSEFFSQIKQLTSNSDNTTVGDVIKTMDSYKQQTTRLYTSTLHQVTRGKIKGNTMGIVHFTGTEYDMETATGTQRMKMALSSTQSAYQRAAEEATKKQVVFRDTLQFLNNLTDYMNVTKDKGELGASLRNFALESAQLLRDSKAGVATTAQGEWGLIARAPALAAGNFRLMASFRSPHEMNESVDPLFRMIKDSKSARKILHKFEEDAGLVTVTEKKVTNKKGEEVVKQIRKGTPVESFDQLLDLEKQHPNLVRTLFEDFAANLRQWNRGTGGGSVFIVKDMANAKIDGKVRPVDLGFATGSLADADGDWASFMTLSKEQRKVIAAKMADPTSAAAYIAAQQDQTIASSVYAEYAKKGLVSTGVLNETSDEILRKDLLKEKTSASGTGSVDVALNKLRNASLAFQTEDPRLLREMVPLFQMLEEHTTIKSKKLADFKPWAERLSASVDEAFRRDNIAPFANFLKTEIFPEADMKELYAGFDVEASGRTTRIEGLDAIFGYLQKAIVNAKANKIDLMATPNIAATTLAGDEVGVARELFAAITSGKATMQSGMAAEFFGDRANQNLAKAEVLRQAASNLMDKIDVRGAGLAVGALALGAITVGAVSGGATSSPLMVEGEMPVAGLNRAVSDGFLEGSEARGMSGGPMSDVYDMTNTPQGHGVTYMSGGAGFDIRGATSSLANTETSRAFINLVTKGNARGSVVINDTRRPITPNYLDRLNGEY